MPTSQQSVYYATPLSNRTEAISYLNNYTQWSIGKFYTILYHRGTPTIYGIDTQGNRNNATDVCAIVAVGIKNASECGPMGQYSADVWENKFYPSGAKGPEFYTIVKDSGEDTSSGGGGGDVDLNDTVVNINNNTYTVANQEGEDQIIPDPFAFREMTYENN